MKTNIRFIALVALCGAAIFLVGFSDAQADGRCRRVAGALTLLPVVGPGCTSPVGVCGEGRFSGSLRGGYTSQLTSIVTTPDTAQTSCVLITGDTVLRARIGRRHGEIVFKDSGAFHTDGEGEFSELFSVVSGTEDFAGATGVLFVTGRYDFAAGGTGWYQGRLCAE